MSGQNFLWKLLSSVLVLPLLYVSSLSINAVIKIYKVGMVSPGLFLLPVTVNIFNISVATLFLASAVLWKKGKIPTLVFLLPGISGFFFNLFLLLNLFGISSL